MHSSSSSVAASQAQATGNVLLIVPPFAVTYRPALGVHILQACAHDIGIQVDILYANLAFASIIGLKNFDIICNTPHGMLTGERVFAATAYEEVPTLGRDADIFLQKCALPDEPEENGKGKEDLQSHFRQIKLKRSKLRQIATQAEEWAEAVVETALQHDYKVIGCTTMFEQTAASITLLNRIKQRCPDIITIIGGPNCENEMAEGVAALSPHIDYVFSGESETTFLNFLQQIQSGQRPEQRIIYGEPCHHLDQLPTPSFAEYYEQVHHYLPQLANNPEYIQISYETSRGCWWGQKHHCTFCGLNGMGMNFREKSPAKVIEELNTLLTESPSQRVQMSDNIMPYIFFKTLLPQMEPLTQAYPELKIFYEQKANLSLEQVLSLQKAGITHIQPGIEALSTSLLRRMDKGVTASQNVALLRYATATNITLDWNMLWGFPNDDLEEYKETLALMPLLHHLRPPAAFFHLSLDRFSPHFENANKYNITNIRPWKAYSQVLPDGVDTHKVAYHFDGEYECDSHDHPEVIHAIEKEMAIWQQKWENTHIKLFFGKFKVAAPPMLQVTRLADDRFLLKDTRNLIGTQAEYELNRAQASAALAPRRYRPTPALEWAIEHKVGIILDKGQYVPLAIAEPELMLVFEQEVQQNKKRQFKRKRRRDSIPVAVTGD